MVDIFFEYIGGIWHIVMHVSLWYVFVSLTTLIILVYLTKRLIERILKSEEVGVMVNQSPSVEFYIKDTAKKPYFIRLY